MWISLYGEENFVLLFYVLHIFSWNAYIGENKWVGHKAQVVWGPAGEVASPRQFYELTGLQGRNPPPRAGSRRALTSSCELSALILLPDEFTLPGRLGVQLSQSVSLATIMAPKILLINYYGFQLIRVLNASALYSVAALAVSPLIVKSILQLQSYKCVRFFRMSQRVSKIIDYYTIYYF